MDHQNTISLQEVRKNPLSFFQKLNQGKTLVVIYHSKPYATVKSVHNEVEKAKNTKRMLEYAKLARNSSKSNLDNNKNFKELYGEDMAKKYGIS